MMMLLMASALLVLAVQPGESLGGVRKWKSAVRAEASRASHFAKPDFVTTRVDHFDGSNPDTWQQAYYVNDSYWKGPNTDAPVFLCVGGEGPPLTGAVVQASVHCNVAVEFLEETGALMFALEHRYYGCHNMSACPVSEFPEPAQRTPEKLREVFRFHSSHQALADLAHFVSTMKEKYGIEESAKWITFGGSYPGMLASFARGKFPHLIYASVASSAPVRAKLEMKCYNDVVASAYTVSDNNVGGSPDCSAAITDGHAQIGTMLNTSSGRETLARLFPSSVKSAEWLEDVANQRNFAGEGVAYFPAQGNDPACDDAYCNIGKICEVMTNVSWGSEVERLAMVAEGQAKAGQVIRAAPLGDDADISELFWPWQTCTEFGFYQTCDVMSECPFTRGLSTLESSMEFCTSVFGIPADTVADNIAQTNVEYGSLTPHVSRILWPNGEVDPWHCLAVLKAGPGLGQETLFVDGASHHAWTHPTLPTDQASVVQARSEIRKQISMWLSE